MSSETLSGVRHVKNGRLSDTDDENIEVGYISASVARRAGIKPGRIILPSGALKHILDTHPDIGSTPRSAIAFIRFVTQNFEQIRQGNPTKHGLPTFLLVATVHSKYGVVCIRINEAVIKGKKIWEVATSQYRRSGDINAHKLLAKVK